MCDTLNLPIEDLIFDDKLFFSKEKINLLDLETEVSKSDKEEPKCPSTPKKVSKLDIWNIIGNVGVDYEWEEVISYLNDFGVKKGLEQVFNYY
jgi:hypothetical protein